MIGDCYPMSVSAEVAEHLLGAAERWLAIDHPARDKKLTHETPKQFGFRQAAEQAVEPQLPGSMGLLQLFDELTAKDFTENSFREKKAKVSGAHPVRVVRREATGGDDAV